MFDFARSSFVALTAVSAPMAPSSGYAMDIAEPPIRSQSRQIWQVEKYSDRCLLRADLPAQAGFTFWKRRGQNGWREGVSTKGTFSPSVEFIANFEMRYVIDGRPVDLGPTDISANHRSDGTYLNYFGELRGTPAVSLMAMLSGGKHLEVHFDYVDIHDQQRRHTVSLPLRGMKRVYKTVDRWCAPTN